MQQVAISRIKSLFFVIHLHSDLVTSRVISIYMTRKMSEVELENPRFVL